MPHFVSVPAETIETFLQSKGFSRSVVHNEVVYERAHSENPRVKVKVYTSIRIGADVARRRGKDSIKVCTVVEGTRKSYGIGKFPRVHRTGSPEKVLDRMLQRSRHERAHRWIVEDAICLLRIE